MSGPDEQGPLLELGDMSPRESTSIDDLIMTALNCKIQGDLHGSLRSFREVLSHQFDSGFDIGRRVTAKLNIASVLNMLQRPQTALGQAVDALVDLQQQCPLLRSVIAQQSERSYNRNDLQQMLTDLAKIPECLHVLVPAAWLQCAVALEALGNFNLSELALKRHSELEKYMITNYDNECTTQPRDSGMPSFTPTSHAIILPQHQTGVLEAKAGKRPHTARERMSAHSKSRSRSGRPSTAAASRGRPSTAAASRGRPSTAAASSCRPSTAAASRGRPSTAAASSCRPSTAAASRGRPSTAAASRASRYSRASTDTQSTTSYRMTSHPFLPKRPATARPAVGTERAAASSRRPSSACYTSSSLSARTVAVKGGFSISRARNSLLDDCWTPADVKAFDEEAEIEMLHGGGCCVSQAAAAPKPAPIRGTFRPPPSPKIGNPPPLVDLFCPLPPPSASKSGASIGGPTGKQGRPNARSGRTGRQKARLRLQSDSAQTMLFGQNGQTEQVEIGRESDIDHSATMIQKAARKRQAKRKVKAKREKKVALQQIQGAIRGNTARAGLRDKTARVDVAQTKTPQPTSDKGSELHESVIQEEEGRDLSIREGEERNNPQEERVQDPEIYSQRVNHMLAHCVGALEEPAPEPEAEAEAEVAPEEYSPLPGRGEMKSLKEEIFEMKTTLPVFAHETTQAEQRYTGSDPDHPDLKQTARAVIKQLERLDKRNLFKLKGVTNTWLEGGNLAGIKSI